MTGIISKAKQSVAKAVGKLDETIEDDEFLAQMKDWEDCMISLRTLEKLARKHLSSHHAATRARYGLAEALSAIPQSSSKDPNAAFKEIVHDVSKVHRAVGSKQDQLASEYENKVVQSIRSLNENEVQQVEKLRKRYRADKLDYDYKLTEYKNAKKGADQSKIKKTEHEYASARERYLRSKDLLHAGTAHIYERLNLEISNKICEFMTSEVQFYKTVMEELNKTRSSWGKGEVPSINQEKAETNVKVFD